ncbi:MAG: hypothetical protein ACM357_03735 [Gemmatimonadota bacterium]
MMQWIGRALFAAMAVGVLGACERANGTATVSVEGSRAVDSIHPPAVALERFRAGLAGPAERLAGGESSIESLTARWVAAVETHDTATIRRLVIDRAEFAWLYYPASPFARGPLYQSPDVVWFRLQANSEKGIVRVLRRLGGSDMRYRSVACGAAPKIEGENRIWEYCSVQLGEGADARAALLFGGILEHEGRFKFISYANQY